jgi:hypothetical protein
LPLRNGQGESQREKHAAYDLSWMK